MLTVVKIGILSLLETSEPLQVCNRDYSSFKLKEAKYVGGMSLYSPDSEETSSKF